MAEIDVVPNGSQSGAPTATVFIVDDDPDVRQSISILVRSVGLNVETFARAHDFLDAYEHDQPGCLILDVRMPDMSGLELQQALKKRGYHIPTIIITAYAEVPMATQAMRAGAIDFIQKPYSPQRLLERIHEAIQADAETRRSQRQQAQIRERMAALSRRELEVMKMLAKGRTTKQIGSELNISSKTVDNHRGRVLEKMNVENTAQLARLLASTTMIDAD